jgi:hypothetical protein
MPKSWAARKKRQRTADRARAGREVSAQYAFHHGITVGMSQIHQWLLDSRARATEIYRDTYATADDEFDAGWRTGQEWIDQAIAHLNEQIEGRTHAVTADHEEAARG